MAISPKERVQTDQFEAFYVRSQAPVMRAIERCVCGCDYGGNSWTTRAEAHQIKDLLNLRPGIRLLDVGAGSGWPGLYLASLSGCALALVDLPLAGLKIAAERASRDGIAGPCWLAVADAAALPFADESFDAVSHSDLLCCLLQKRAVLEAFRRTITKGGRMVFTVISVAPGLSAQDYELAVKNGPEFIQTETDYSTLLSETGWTLVSRQDITRDYTQSCRRQLAADLDLKDDLLALVGPTEAAEREDGWRSKLAALHQGLLRRELFVATTDAAEGTAP